MYYSPSYMEKNVVQFDPKNPRAYKNALMSFFAHATSYDDKKKRVSDFLERLASAFAPSAFAGELVSEGPQEQNDEDLVLTNGS